MRFLRWRPLLAFAGAATDQPVRPWIVDALHVLVLMNFAIAQPIYDRLSERAGLFVDQQIGMPVAWLLVFLLSVAWPAAVVFLEWLVGCCGRRSYDVGHCLVISALLFLLAVPIFKQADVLHATGMLIGSAICAVWGTRLYWRHPSVRAVVTWASLGVVIFPTIFLVQFSTKFVKVAPTTERTERWNPVPVVVLVLDEFCGSSLMTPEREIDAQRFPHFAALARDTTWFRNATSVNQNTVQALPAILSGMYATTNEAPVPANLPQNLFSVLAVNGYERAIFEPVSVLSPSNVPDLKRSQGLVSQTVYVADFLWRVYLFHVLPLEYHPYLPQIPRLWFGMHNSLDVNPVDRRGVFRYGWNETRDLQFQHILNCLDGVAQPTLYFSHLLLPHVPWCYLPSGSRYATDGDDWQLLSLETVGGLPGGWGTDELELINNQQRYLLQIMYLDQLLGKFIARLKETGLYDRCLLVVTADHGISFRVNQSRRGVDLENVDEILSIPLFVKRPGQRTGGIDERNVESVDILPTIADVVGLKLGRQTDGWSVFDQTHPDRTHKTYGNVGDRKTVDSAIIRTSKIPLTIRERFGEGSGMESLWRTSYVPELIGRRVDSLKLAEMAPIEMEFSRFGDEVTAGPPKLVPCFFEGKLASERTAAGPSVIAVAVNGTIQAVTRTYRQPGLPSRHWSAMVPESVFHLGRNDVRFYQVTGTQPEWLLTPYVAVQPPPGEPEE